MKLLIVLACVTGSQGINYDALVKCTDYFGNDGVMCDGDCFPAVMWCNDLVPHYCADSGVMTNDLELCADDERWKDISCSLTGIYYGQEYPGERCSDCVDGTRNYCIYPQGLPEELPEILRSNMPTTCDCDSSNQSINYDALVPCTDTYYGGEGVKCDGNCYHAVTWCNDLVPRYCFDSGVMSNDLELCANDEFWKPISCSLTGEDGREYPGERCTDCVDGTRNYCSYPQGLPEELLEDKFLQILKSNMPTTCDCVSSQSHSQSINYKALVPCSLLSENDAMKCGGNCWPSYYWCNEKFRKRCPDSGVMTNNPLLCSQDERWSNLTCDIDLVGSQLVDGKLEPLNGTHYPGERCKCTTGTSNYCFYPNGIPEVFSESEKFIMRTACDCVSSTPSTFLAMIPVIVMIAAVGYI